MRNIFISITLLLSFLAQAQHRTITIDLQAEKGPHNTFYKECIGAGRANEGLRADWQKQLKEVKQACDFKYIRFHGLFHNDMGVYFEDDDGKPVYNWQYIDVLYDYLLEIGMKPFVELSFMPEALASGEETVFWWKGNITPPKSYEKWHDLITAFTQHLTNRYGEEEVKTWYFEVWNEPNLNFFWSGGMDGYQKLYSSTVDAIKSVSNDYRVGGPATAGAGWINEHLAFCDSAKVACEFASTHAYNVYGFLDEFGKNQLKMSKSPNDVIQQVKGAREKIESSDYKGLELHITEWSSSYSPRDPVHDTYQNATFILHTLKQTEDMATSMSYWVFTDIFEESDIPQTPFHGGFGLMNMQGIKKPTYFSYKYLNQLGDTELQNKDEDSWACKQGDDVQLLLWDFSYPNQGDESNQTYYRKPHPAKSKGSVAIELSNLAKGKYTLEVYKTGYKQNDVFTAYYQMGLPSQLSKTQVNQLHAASADEAVISEQIKIKNGKFTKQLPLNQNDIYLLKLVKQ